MPIFWSAFKCGHAHKRAPRYHIFKIYIGFLRWSRHVCFCFYIVFVGGDFLSVEFRMASMILMCCFPSGCNESAIPFEWVCCVWCLPVVQFSDLSCIRSLPSLEPWRPRDVPRAGRPPPRRVARGRRPGGRPSAARRRAARSAVPAGASPRRVAMMPKFVVRLCFGFRHTVLRYCASRVGLVTAVSARSVKSDSLHTQCAIKIVHVYI